MAGRSLPRSAGKNEAPQAQNWEGELFPFPKERLQLALESLQLSLEWLQLSLEWLQLGLEWLQLGLEWLQLGLESLQVLVESLYLAKDFVATHSLRHVLRQIRQLLINV